MNKLTQYALACLLSMITSSVYADAIDHSGLSDSQQRCYSRAMVGLDSVINSRIGVPIEEAMEITRKQGQFPIGDQFEESYLMAVLNAYLWSGTPHTYAIKVFSDCTLEQDSQFTQARAG